MQVQGQDKIEIFSPQIVNFSQLKNWKPQIDEMRKELTTKILFFKKENNQLSQSMNSIIIEQIITMLKSSNEYNKDFIKKYQILYKKNERLKYRLITVALSDSVNNPVANELITFNPKNGKDEYYAITNDLGNATLPLPINDLYTFSFFSGINNDKLEITEYSDTIFYKKNYDLLRIKYDDKIEKNIENKVIETITQNSVTIGKQVWMSENLTVDHFRNGDPIPQAQTTGEWTIANLNNMPAWCYYENDLSNGKKYGKMYNWYAVNDVRGLAPLGYHIPSDAEWTTLTNYLVSESSKKMKSTSGWNNGGNGTNTSGFAGLPGGGRSGNGSFNDIGNLGHWWSSTENLPTTAWPRSLSYRYNDLFRNSLYKSSGLSVRCLRD